MWKQGETLIPLLLLVDILSRKAWVYVPTKSKKEKRAEVSVKTKQEFKDEVGIINGLEGDNEFSSAPIKSFCSSYGADRTVGGAIFVLSVQPVLRRVESPAVDVSDRGNPVTSSRIVILAHRVPFLVA